MSTINTCQFNYNSERVLTPRSGYLAIKENSEKATQAALHVLRQQDHSLPPGTCILITGSQARLESVQSSGGVEPIIIHTTAREKPTDVDRPGSNMADPISSSSPFQTYNPVPASPHRISEDPINSELHMDWGNVALNNSFNCRPSAASASTPLLNRTSSTKNSECEELITRIQEIIKKHPKQFPFAAEIYSIGKEGNPLRYDKEKIRFTIPTRALDAIPLEGEEEVWKQYRKEAFQNLVSMKKDHRKDFEKHFVDPALQELKDCLNGTKTQPIDLSQGILHFDNDRMMSTKYVLLRPLQYHLIQYLIHYAHGKEFFVEKLTNEFPTSIEERIRWMHKEGYFPTLDKDRIEAVCQTYHTALLWYERSHRAYAENNTQEVQINRESILLAAETISSFIKDTPLPEIANTTPKKEARSLSRRSNQRLT